jgi:hypothetical protein
VFFIKKIGTSGIGGGETDKKREGIKRRKIYVEVGDA